jgi:glyoxalase/bleomycin resistance protein/dioxygenase superfamily protein
MAERGGTPPPEGHTGLHHFAILYPDRRELARAVERLLEYGYPIGGAEDHGASVSAYLSDPDGNGIELYYDRPREEWGSPKAEPFDPRDLATYWWRLAPPFSPYPPKYLEAAFSEVRMFRRRPRPHHHRFRATTAALCRCS